MTQAPQTRASLLARVRDWGDDASWQQFFDTYSRLIFSLALKAGLSETEAEEVLQTTMASVARRIREFEYDRAVGSFKVWLCTDARSKIIDMLRRRRREQALFVDKAPAPTGAGTCATDRIPDEHDGFAQFMEHDWNEALAATALAGLKATVPPKQYQIFDLYVVKRWPLRRVSRTLGISMATVYVVSSRISFLLKRQIKHLQARLERPPKLGPRTTNEPSPP